MAKRFPLVVAAVALFSFACRTAPPLPPYSAGSDDDPEARRNWYWNQRTYPTGTIPVEAHQAAVRRELAETRALAGEEEAWTSLGPAPLRAIPLGNTTTHDAAGRTLAIALHPADPRTLLIGTAMGGIWKTVNGGQSFYSTGPEQTLPTLAIGVLKYRPDDPNVLYAGTGEPHGSVSMYGSGLLRSTDGGETWQQLPMRGDGWSFEYTAITGLHFDARDANTLYVTTATVTSSFFRTPPSLPPTGFFKSTDGGMSWRLLHAATKHPGPSGSVGFLDLEYGGDLAPDLFFVSEYHGGILRSRDGGASFQYVTPQRSNGFGTFPERIEELAFYDSKLRQYLRLKRFDNPEATADFRRVEVAIAPSNPNVLFAGYESSNRLDYDGNGKYESALDRALTMSLLFKSEDGGDTWRWLGTVFDGIPDYCARQCQYDNVITINPENENDILIGGMANYNQYDPEPLSVPRRITVMPWRGMVYRSLDGGRSWVDTTPHCATIKPPTATTSIVYQCSAEDPAKVIHPDIHAIHFGKDGAIYVANDGGLYRTTVPLSATATPSNRRRSAGKYIPGANIDYRWQTLNNGLATLQFYRIASHPTDPNILLGGMQDNSSGYWNGEVWEGWGGGDGTIAEFDPETPSVVYMGTQFAVHRHTKGGSKTFDASWRFNLFDPSKVAAGETTSFVPVFTLDRVQPEILYGASDKALYRSTNYGEKFNRVNTTEVLEGTPTSISVSTADHNRVYVGTSAGRIYRYDFTGNNAVMTGMTKGLPKRHVAQVMAAADSPNTVYAVFSGYDANTPSTPGKIFMSTDGGANWVNISANLPDVPGSAIAIDPIDPNRMWIALDTAVYSTRDRGATWVSERRNMPIVAILDLDYNRNTGFLVAATHGRGAWRMRVDPQAK